MSDATHALHIEFNPDDTPRMISILTLESGRLLVLENIVCTRVTVTESADFLEYDAVENADKARRVSSPNRTSG